MADFMMPTGIEFFEQLRRNGCYYVDKSELIYKIAEQKNISVTLFTRPRRFGKTLTMSMLESFFDITRDSRDVFEGLNIVKHKEFCMEWMNQYPVMMLSLKDAASLDFATAYKKLKSSIAGLCIAHAYLESSGKVDPADAEVFKKLKFKKADDDEVQNALLILTRMLNAHYGRQVILLIDEYDVPLAKAHDVDKESKDYYPKMLEAIRGLMSSALKTNPFLKFAVITGCLRIAKESVFTGVNNFATYSILDEWFSDSFGFTETEVKEILKEAELTDRLALIKSWYDGYIFGNKEVFCPWDVAKYVDSVKKVPGKAPDNFWKNTSSNDIIDHFVEDEKFHVSDKFETLLNGGTIEQTITDQLTYGELKDDENNLWSVLFMTGYLTKADKTETGNTVRLRIPNAEISSIFEDSVVKHFRGSLDRNIQNEVIDALWNKQENEASKLITGLLWDTISYHNYHENYYHAFITGIFAGGAYSVKSDQENGLGRTDIVIRDRKNRRAVIIEAKKSKQKKDMETMCLEAKQQMIDRKYSEDSSLDGYNEIICYGISFYKKYALVRLLDLGERLIEDEIRSWGSTTP